MTKITNIFIGLIAAIHFYIAYFEIFAWTDRGPQIFKSLPKELFQSTIEMAANQGLYNGFLAAGLVWCLLIKDHRWSKNIGIFFLSCIAIAGIYGAYSIEQKILFIQTLPAVIAILLLSKKTN